MAGAGPGELIGQRSSILFDSHEDWEETGRIAYSVTPPGGTYESEHRFRRRDGSTFICRTRGRRSSPPRSWRGR